MQQWNKLKNLSPTCRLKPLAAQAIKPQGMYSVFPLITFTVAHVPPDVILKSVSIKPTKAGELNGLAV